jgi:hypothetical protein
LQAVFAAWTAPTSRTTRSRGCRQRSELVNWSRLERRKNRTLEGIVRAPANELQPGPAITAAEIPPEAKRAGAFGYHSAIEPGADVKSGCRSISASRADSRASSTASCHDDFNGIGEGFGFPVRYKSRSGRRSGVQASAVDIVDPPASRLPNPGN